MGKRIKGTGISEQTQFEPNLRLLVDKLDADAGLFPWLQAKRMELKYLGNAYFQGSTNNSNWHDAIAAGDSFIRFSTDGGTTVKPLDTDTVREGSTNLYFTDARVIQAPGVADAITLSHLHTNKSVLDNIIDSGTGDSFLADDGTYFNVLGGLTEDTVPIKGALGFEDSPITLDGTDIVIDGTLTHDSPTLDTQSALLADITGGSRVGKFSSVIATNLTDNYIPYHVSDAAGFANSAIFKDGTSIKIGDGTNNIEFEANGTIKFNGSSTYWLDIDFPIIIRTTGVGIPTLTTLNGNLTLPAWAVNDFNLCESQEFIHPWKEGSVVYWHIHLTTNGSNVDNRYVRFEVEYGYVTPNGEWIFPAVMDSGDLLIPANTPTKTMMIMSLGNFTPTGIEIGGHVVARLKRIASTGTAPTNSPYVPMLQLHVECDTVGSREIADK